MKKLSRETDALAPKPVRPHAIRTHGLFGIPYVRQHMIVDKKWTPSSLTEEFSGMNNLLAKRAVALNLEKKTAQMRSLTNYRKLRNLCRTGRQRLQMILSGSNALDIRHFLVKNKELQRLYQRMPAHLVVDNINQRTFSMRKERDRLRYRLKQLEEKYKQKLVDRATLETRIKYYNEFILIEEIKAWELKKKLENSSVRLKAINVITRAYKKMLQTLKYDSIFFEPILQSLDRDIADQGQFIKHILYIGMPAISKFKELREEYRLFEDRVRKDTQSKIQLLNTLRSSDPKTFSQPKVKFDPMQLQRRYVRETRSMLWLKFELEDVASTIKLVKMATLCSEEKEIYQRIKSKVENNIKLQKRSEKDILGREVVEMKLQRALVLKGMLQNDLSDEEKKRLAKIEELKQLIKKEDEIEADFMANLSKGANAYVLFRRSAWNLYDIVRNVESSPKAKSDQYPEYYLKLPLLKFDLLNMRSVPPPPFESKVSEIMSIVHKKVKKLMTGVSSGWTPADIESFVDSYHRTFVEFKEMDEPYEPDSPNVEGDQLLEQKLMQGIKSRKQLKAESAKLVEESIKKDET